MDLNKNQFKFLLEIGKQNGRKGITEIGRKIYNTHVSVYNNMKILRNAGYIFLNRKKNVIIATLTPLGIEATKVYIQVSKDLNSI